MILAGLLALLAQEVEESGLLGFSQYAHFHLPAVAWTSFLPVHWSRATAQNLAGWEGTMEVGSLD